MKKLLYLAIILFSWPISSSLSAQNSQSDSKKSAAAKTPEPDVSHYFPGLNWKNYISAKAVVLYLDYYDLNVPDSLEFLVESDEEGDSLFTTQLISYLEIPDNCELIVAWIDSYYKKFPGLKNSITRDDIIIAIKGEFGNFLTPEILANLDKQKIRAE